MPKADAILTMMSAAHKTMMHKSFKSGFGIFCEMVGGGHPVGGGRGRTQRRANGRGLAGRGRGTVFQRI